MASGEEAETQSESPSVIMPALKIPESSPTTGPIGAKVPINEASLVQVCLHRLKKTTMILDLSLLLTMLANSCIQQKRK